MLDSVQNFVKVTVSTGYGSAATSIVLTAGQGALMPSPSYSVVWWNVTDYLDPSDDPNVEIVRVTGVSVDTLTVTRGQEGTSASAKNVAGKTYRMILGITAKMITDIAGNLHKPWTAPAALIGNIDGVNTMFQLASTAADVNSLQVTLARQPQLLGVDVSYSVISNVPYIIYGTAPPASLAGQGHYAQYQ